MGLTAERSRVGDIAFIEVDVSFSEVGGDHGAVALAEVEVDMEVERVGADGGAERFEGGSGRLAAFEGPGDFVGFGGAIADVDLVFDDCGGGIAEGIDNAAPVGVTAVPAGFDQGAIGYGAGGGFGIGVGACSVDAEGYDAMDAFTVAYDHFCEFEADVIEGGLELLEVFFAGGVLFGFGFTEGCIAGLAVGEDEDGIVRTHISVDRDAVEAEGDGLGECVLERFSIDLGICGEEAQHGGVEGG